MIVGPSGARRIASPGVSQQVLPSVETPTWISQSPRLSINHRPATFRILACCAWHPESKGRQTSHLGSVPIIMTGWSSTTCCFVGSRRVIGMFRVASTRRVNLESRLLARVSRPRSIRWRIRWWESLLADDDARNVTTSGMSSRPGTLLL